MSATANVTQYRSQYIDTFQQKVSKFRAATTRETVINGNSAVFAAVNPSGAATTRGLNGLIPATAPDFSQYTATLSDINDLQQMTGFHILSTQGDAKRAMLENSVAVLNRKIDDMIITALSTGTNDTGSAVTAHVGLFLRAKAILGRNDVAVDEEDKVFCALSPAAEALLSSAPEWSSAPYVDVKPFVTGGLAGAMRMKRWNGINFFQSNRLSGVGTSTEKLLMWHSGAIGFAANTEGLDVDSDINREQNYSWARATLFAGAKLLQNSGVVVINHNGSGLEAE